MRIPLVVVLATVGFACLAHSPLVLAQITDAVIEDFTDVLTATDLGLDDFSGNLGSVNSPGPTAYGKLLLPDRMGREGAVFQWDFTPAGGNNGVFTGVFLSLFGLTDTKVSLDGGDPTTMSFQEHVLDLDRADGLFEEPGGPRKYLSLGLDVSYQGTAELTVRLEIKSAGGPGRYCRFKINPAAAPQTLLWDFRNPQLYTALPDGDLDVHRAKELALVIEQRAVASNPDRGELRIRRIWFTTDKPETEPASDSDLLDLVERRACQYFFDWRSRKPGSEGIPQDRSTFADLLTVGGIGFALPAYIIAAERGWIPRAEAARLTLSVLRQLGDPERFGPERVARIGHRGFFYHFLGPDGRRKMNFDFAETPVHEDRNTVELSSIDTGLALMGVLTAQSYFQGPEAVETEIRALAQTIYDSVDWPFMLHPPSGQFYLAWKPNEERDESPAFGGPYRIPDAQGEGSYSGDATRAGTLDYYTDEALIVTLLALGSTAHPVPPGVRCSWIRDSDSKGLTRSYPGSLFTYFFFRAFLDSTRWRPDRCAGHTAVDWLANSKLAFQSTIDYASGASPAFLTYGPDAWGLSAAEGPDDRYRAYGAPPIAISTYPEEDGTVTYYGMVSAVSFGAELRQRVIQALRSSWAREGHWHHRFGLPDAFNASGAAAAPVFVEAESGQGGVLRQREHASGESTVWLQSGEALDLKFELRQVPGRYTLSLRASNDNYGALEPVSVLVDGVKVGELQPADTGDGGDGWDVFLETDVVGPFALAQGPHTLRFEVGLGDAHGVEIDRVLLRPADIRPWVQRALFAIDQGPMALHLENARSGLIWRVLAQNPNIVRGLRGLEAGTDTRRRPGRHR